MRKGILTAMVLSCLMCFNCAKDVRPSAWEDSAGGEGHIDFFVQYSLVGMSVKSSSGPNDINLFVVNDRGDVVADIYLNGNGGGDKYKIGANIQKGDEYTLYSVANAGKKLQAANVMELEAMYHIVSLEGDVDDSRVLMSGKSSPQRLQNGTVVNIGMERCISKIILRADYSALNSDVDLEVKRISLKNVPDRVKLFGRSRIVAPEHSVDGETRSGISREGLQQGIAFYQYENMQGTLQPENGDCTKKVWPQESIYSRICSYVEMEASYSSPRKKGEILYRFYLGSDMTSNYDVVRNTSQTVTVNFRGDGAVDENTWRVDHSGISNLVTSVSVNPQELKFIGTGGTVQLEALVLPQDASDRRLSFRSSDGSVASVDEAGKVLAVGEGECLVVATSCDGTEISDTCRVIVRNPQIAFDGKGRVMYDGEVARVDYDVLSPSDVEVKLLLSNNNAQIIDSDSKGFTVKATAPGTCVVTASAGSATAVYELDIRKLAIVVEEKLCTAYNHFYYDFDYTVVPEHAAGMGVKITLDPALCDHVEACGGNRVLVSVDEGLGYPDGVYDVLLAVEGREDVSEKVQLVVRESSVADVKIVPGLSRNSGSVAVDFATAPGAFNSMVYSVSGVYGECSQVGSLDGNLRISLVPDNPLVTVTSPSVLNGRYNLEFVAAGDDKKVVKMNSMLEIYEPVYVAAVSKPVACDHISQKPVVWEYVHEVVLETFSFPGSRFFDEGELYGTGIGDFEYMLDGRLYSDMAPDVTISQRFTFRSGEEYPQFPSGTWVYKGNEVPESYMAFYPIDIRQPWVFTSEKKLVYLVNRVFGGGFCNEDTDWTEIFGTVYQ